MGNNRLTRNCGPRDVNWILCVGLLLLVSGCSQDEKMGSVHGTVRLDGKPLATGTIQFVPSAGRAANGKIASDGTYTLGTFAAADGALIGPHKVAVVAYESGGDGRPAYEARTQTSKSLVPQMYMAVGTSGLTYDVKAGENQADFELKSR